MSAQNFPRGHTCFVDEFGFEGKRRVLIYDDGKASSIYSGDQRITILNAKNLIKEIVVLTGNDY